jgi:hypothetical protein
MAEQWHGLAVLRTRVSTTVDGELLSQARKAIGAASDAALFDQALDALMPRTGEVWVVRAAGDQPATGARRACVRLAAGQCMYCACMPNVQVRDVPDDVHEALIRRAEQAGQSLQQFLATQLAVIAATPTTLDVLDRIERRSKGTLSAKTTIEILDADRDRR